MISLYIAVCGAAFLALLWLVRLDRVSLGLPIAYLALLLLNHVPGAYAHVAGAGRLFGDDLTAIGIGYTAVGSVCFVLGVAIARLAAPQPPVVAYEDRGRFAMFCLLGGWFLTYGLTPLRGLPSLGAAVDKGAAIWVLGVILGLRMALQRGDKRAMALWGAAMFVYPVLMLVSGGFISYGSSAIIIACAALAVSVRSPWRVLAGVALVTVLSMSLFVNYFGNRDEMRATVWGNSGIAAKVDANLAMFRNFEWFSPSNLHHLNALDQRLNQNLFVGLAETRIKSGSVDYLYGRSVSDAVLSLVPRALWPDKPFYGGSPKIVSDMTGLRLNQNTSFGVGQVMEFQINFGLIGVILGFTGLGWLIAFLDRKAATAERHGDLGRTILFFLPAAALMQPLGSMVELASGAAAATVAALGWRWAWTRWSTRTPARARRVHAARRPAGEDTRVGR